MTVQTDNVIGWRGYTQLNGLDTNIKKSYTLIPHTSTSTRYRYLRIRIWIGLLVSSFYAFFMQYYVDPCGSGSATTAQLKFTACILVFHKLSCSVKHVTHDLLFCAEFAVKVK